MRPLIRALPGMVSITLGTTTVPLDRRSALELACTATQAGRIEAETFEWCVSGAGGAVSRVTLMLDDYGIGTLYLDYLDADHASSDQVGLLTTGAVSFGLALLESLSDAAMLEVTP